MSWQHRISYLIHLLMKMIHIMEIKCTRQEIECNWMKMVNWCFWVILVTKWRFMEFYLTMGDWNIEWKVNDEILIVLMFLWMRVKKFYVKGDNVDKCNWLFSQDCTGEIKHKYSKFRCINLCEDCVFLNSFCHLIMKSLT